VAGKTEPYLLEHVFLGVGLQIWLVVDETALEILGLVQGFLEGCSHIAPLCCSEAQSINSQRPADMQTTCLHVTQGSMAHLPALRLLGSSCSAC